MLIPVAPFIKCEKDNQRCVELKEFGGNRNLTIQMANLSAEYLTAALQKIELPTSPSHQALHTCLQCLQGNIEKLEVYDLIEGQFKSRMILNDQRDNRTYSVEVNVIDGIIIALIVMCPIFVIDGVFKQRNVFARKMALDYFAVQAQIVFSHLDTAKEKKM